MKHYVIVCILAVGVSSQLLAPRQVWAQGTFNRTITFDGPPVIPPGWSVGVTYYYEDSMTFRPINAGEYFVRAGPGQAAGFPDNGTAYVLQGAFTSLSGSRDGRSRFGLYSVDLSEFSTLYAFPRAVQFIGYRPDGSIVTIEFSTDGVIDGAGPVPDFQTFYFDSQFSDLVRFEVPTRTYALDNLVFFDVIPEARVASLLIFGAGVLAVLRFFKRNG